MDTLQNYRFYKNDKTGLKITFANEPREMGRRPEGRGDRDRPETRDREQGRGDYDRRKH
jgi:hypothetical protein